MSIENFYFGNCQGSKDLRVYALDRMGRVEGPLEKRLRLWVARQVDQMEHGTKQQFAKEIHRRPGWISKYTSKIAYATLDDIVLMAIYFGISPEKVIAVGELPELPLAARQVAEAFAQLEEPDQQAIRRRIEALVPPARRDAAAKLGGQNHAAPKARERRNRGRRRGA